MTEQVLANRYKVIRKLGEGGMGAVYQVEDSLSKEVVAFKILSKQIADSPETLLQFKQEFRVMNKLKHPNTVNVFDYGLMPDKSPYLTMEVVPGNELSDLKELDFNEICRILIQLCQALSFIHSRLLVHCDIKPQNIRIRDDGSVKLMDFGLMNQLGLRSNGQITGTVDYLPPEIPTGGIINASSDLYSVGVVAYELITGRLPFVGNSVLEVIRAHINSPVSPPGNYRQDIPEQLEKVVMKLMEKSQQERYQTASEVIADLVELSGEEVVAESIEQKRSYLNSSVLVGRDHELKVLEETLVLVDKGYGKSAFVAAPAGVGKSRLVQEFKLQVQLAEKPFLSGLCFEQGMSAYKPVADALKQVIPLSTKEELQKYGNVLVKILPELREKGFEPLANLEGISEKLRLFDTITAWLADVSVRDTLVIFIDDLHWIDQASIDLLNTCIRDLRRSKILFMGTFRDDEVPAGHPLWQTFDEELTKLVKLDAFTTEDIRSLIKAMLGSIDLKTEFVEHVRNATGGNAFFISEVMRYLVEEGILQIKFGTWFLPADYTAWELPTSIEATVNRRLNSLSPKAMELIRLAAVAGRKLRLSLFKAVSGWEEEEIFSSIDELIERQFLNRLEHEYLFPHDRVRETLYDSLEETLRKDLHYKVAETIENENLTQLINVSGELAYHFSRSFDVKRAIKYLFMAGFSSPVRMEASQSIKHATDLLEHTDENFPESWLNTYLFEICGRIEKSVNEARESAGENFDKNFVLELGWKKLAWISYMIAPKICLDTSEKLIEALEKKGFDLNTTAEFESIRASSYTMMGQNEKAFSITKPVIDNEKYKDTLVRGLMLFGELNGLLTTGRFRQLVGEMEESVDILERNFSKLHSPLIWAYGFASFIRNDAVAWLGEEVGNNKYSETVVEIAKKHNHLDLEFWTYYPDVVRFSYTGHYDKIKSLQEKLMNMVKRMGKPIQHENRLNVCIAFAAIQNGQIFEAKSMTKKIVELGKRLGNPHQQANGFILEAMILMEENKFMEAIDLFKHAVNLSQTEDGKLKNDQLIPALYRLAEAYLKNHEHEEALKYAEKAHELASSDEFENPYHLINTYRLLGQIHADNKEYEKAHEFLMKSASIAKDNEIIIQEAFTQTIIGEIWLERKKFDLTRTTWQKAIAKFREINNEYQASKLIPRLNSVPKPSLSSKTVVYGKDTEKSDLKVIPQTVHSENPVVMNTHPDKATEIGYKLMELLSAIGITGGGTTHSGDKHSEESHAESKALIEKLRKVELLNNFGQMILSSLELNTVLPNVIERIMEVSEADRGFLILLNEKGELYSQVIKTKDGSAGENKVINFSKTFTEEVLKTGKSLWVADAQADSRYATQKSVLAMDLRTVICVPLKDKDRVIGLIYVDRQSVIRTFSEDDLNLVESVATFASIAIVNARLHHQANEKNEKLQMLNELSRTISNAFTRSELLYKVLGFAIRITGAEIGYVLTSEELKCEASLDKEGNTEIEVKVSSSVIKKVMETGKSVSLVDTMDDKAISTQASIIALDIRSVMCVPLISNKKILGVMYMSSRTLVKSFTPRDLSLLEDIVGQTALAIENLTLLEVQIKQDQMKQELNIARNIQKSMLPSHDPEFDNIEISGYSCSATEVGGDYYDYIMLDDNRFAIAFGDVTGHGVSAGLLMAMAKSCMFVQCKVDPNVIAVMTALNNMILGGKTERRTRMGFLYTIFDLKNMEINISSAGHPLPYFYKHEIRDLEPIKIIPGYQLGVKENSKFRELTIKLGYKDVLVYFTDGIVEARNIDGEEYGYDRLEEFIRINSFLSSKELKDAILEDYYKFIEGLEEMDDDITIVVVKVKPPAGEKEVHFQKA